MNLIKISGEAYFSTEIKENLGRRGNVNG